MVGGAFIGAAVLEANAGALAAVVAGAVLGLVGWLGLSGVGRSAAVPEMVPDCGSRPVAAPAMVRERVRAEEG